MRKIDIARRIALEARLAARSGRHRRAAELYAEALRALLGTPQEPSPGASAAPAERRETPSETIEGEAKAQPPPAG